MQRLEPHAPLCIGVRVLLLELTCDAGHVVAGLLERHARPQAGDHTEIVGPPRHRHRLRCRAQRSPELHVFPRKKERARHHAHDLVVAAAQRDRPTNDGGVAAECRLPQTMAQDGDARLAFPLLVVGKRSSEQRRGSQDPEQVAAHGERFHAQRLTGAGEEEIARAAAV